MNEPAVFNETKTMAPDVIHGNDGVPRSHRELHNLYALRMGEATYQGLLEQGGGQRPFVLSRAGYAGIQRYAAIWTGDNRSFWEHMEMAIPMVLNLGLSGIPFAGPDIGGFDHNADGELLARWTQMGALFPFCRNHSAIGTVRQEPWQFGAEVEAICRDAIRLRYRWMPYLYTLFREAADTGVPVLRPLALEFPQDDTAWNVSDQFLFGPDILAAPVLRPHLRQRMVFLPSGDWIDYWTGERLQGERWLIAPAPLRQMPLYIRAGAIIPEHPISSHADFAAVDHMTFALYGAPATPVVYSLYEDDGATLDYQHGACNRFEVRNEPMHNGLAVAFGYTQRGWQAPYRFREFRVCNLSAHAMLENPDVPLRTEAEWSYATNGWRRDEASGDLFVRLPGEETEGQLRIVW